MSYIIQNTWLSHGPKQIADRITAITTTQPQARNFTSLTVKGLYVNSHFLYEPGLASLSSVFFLHLFCKHEI